MGEYMGTVHSLIMKIAVSLLIVAVVTYFTDKADAEVIGTIDVGSVGTIYVWKQFGNIVMEGNGFRMTGDSRGYLLTKDPGASLTPDSFWQTNLFDQHFTVMRLDTLSKCQLNRQGMVVITTVMLTMWVALGAQSMTHWNLTSTL